MPDRKLHTDHPSRHREVLPAAAIALTAWVAMAGWSCGPAAAQPTVAPASQPATGPAPVVALSGDWPAFHGGGGLRGEAKPLVESGNALAVRWTYKTGEEDRAAVEASVAIVGDAVYIPDLKGTLHAVNLSDGKRKWAYTAGDGLATSPLIVGDNVLLGDLAGVFHCVGAADGRKRWTFDAGGQSIHSSANGDGSRVVFGTDGADIYCLSIADGTKIWEQKTGDRVNGAPGIGWGAAFVSGCDARLRAIDLKDGKERYAADIGALCPGSPAILEDRLVMGLDGGRVVCYSADGQKQLWNYKEIGDGAMVYGSPAVAEGIAVVGARDRHVHAMSAVDGKPLWKFATRGDVDSAPAIAGGKVYVGSKDKKLYTLDLKSGKKLGEFTAGRSILAGPAVGGGVVVIGDTAGNVYCLEAK